MQTLVNAHLYDKAVSGSNIAIKNTAVDVHVVVVRNDELFLQC